MAPKTRPADRLPNPWYELKRAIQRAERGLAAASAEGFREVLLRVRQAVLQSERLVVVLDRLVLQGSGGVTRPILWRRPMSSLPSRPCVAQTSCGCLYGVTGARYVFGFLTFSLSRLVSLGAGVIKPKPM